MHCIIISFLPQQVERVETIQNYEKFGIMNLILETVTSKKSLKLTLQQVIQRVKTEEDSSSLPKLAAYLSLGASIHQICKSPRYIPKYLTIY